VVLGGVAVWWLGAESVFHVSLVKLAVPWPQGVTVDPDFRLDSLPVQLGPYRMIEEDGYFEDRDGQKVKDGKPDGERYYRESDLESLGIGTGFDKMRYDQRSSNWYVSRIYRSTDPADANTPYWAWILDVTFYTGGLDTVPHIPERCLGAGGASLGSTESLIFPAIPGAEGDWAEPLTVRRISFEQAGPRGIWRNSQYYIFSLNGTPQSDWMKVRLTLGLPWVKYATFAKIQFSPWGPVDDPRQADEKAKKFAAAVMPAVLKQLPMPSDIQRLGK
jgi:hypothetical protein